MPISKAKPPSAGVVTTVVAPEVPRAETAAVARNHQGLAMHVDRAAMTVAHADRARVVRAVIARVGIAHSTRVAAATIAGRAARSSVQHPRRSSRSR